MIVDQPRQRALFWRPAGSQDGEEVTCQVLATKIDEESQNSGDGAGSKQGNSN